MTAKKKDTEVSESTVDVAVAVSPRPVIQKLKNYLEDRKVTIRPIPGNGEWSSILQNGDIVKEEPFILKKAKRGYQIPFARGGGLVKIFDNFNAHYTVQFPEERMTEQAFFEKVMGTDLNPLTVTNTVTGVVNFWKDDIRSRIILTRDSKTLDLSDPSQMIQYRVAMAQDNIANSWEERFNGLFDFVIVDEDRVVSRRLEETQDKSDAYAELAKLIASETKMRNFIKATGKSIPMKAREPWLKDQIITTLESDYKKFLMIVKDDLFHDKVFIADALRVQALIKLSSKRYALDNGKEIGTIEDMAHYLRNPNQQELRIRIKGQIERVDDK